MPLRTTDSRLSKIKRKTTAAEPQPQADAPATTPAPARRPTHGGRPAAFWLDDKDREILREFGAIMFARGIKPSDSLIARAALRLLPRDHRFMEAIEELIAQDRRRVRHQKKAAYTGSQVG
ncbi:MAG: hypothetical protein JO069_11840 [Verrucomicrobia bacterium]|nr:hypothetical protein [Verrucomicrobiota bacterium]